jgi:hypothetical protein
MNMRPDHGGKRQTLPRDAYEPPADIGWSSLKRSCEGLRSVVASKNDPLAMAKLCVCSHAAGPSALVTTGARRSRFSSSVELNLVQNTGSAVATGTSGVRRWT